MIWTLDGKNGHANTAHRIVVRVLYDSTGDAECRRLRLKK
jgi:hypothetical protein